MKTPTANPEGTEQGERLAQYIVTCPSCGFESSIPTAEPACDNPYCESKR